MRNPKPTLAYHAEDQATLERDRLIGKLLTLVRQYDPARVIDALGQACLIVEAQCSQKIQDVEDARIKMAQIDGIKHILPI